MPDYVVANLQDPRTGNIAGVDDELRLLTSPISDYQDALANGWAFAWTNAAKDIDITDNILLVANDSPTMNLHITKVMCSSDAAGPQFSIYLPAAATWNGDTVIGVPLNRTINRLAPATAVADDTGASIANIIALIHGAPDTPVSIFGENGEDLCILGENGAIAVDQINEPLESQVIIIGYFKKAA